MYTIAIVQISAVNIQTWYKDPLLQKKLNVNNNILILQK